MGPPFSSVREGCSKVDGAIEIARPVGLQFNVLRFEVCGGVDEPHIFGLQEGLGHNEVLLVGSDFDLMGPDGHSGLVDVNACDIFEVGDVNDGDVVGCCNSH